ncbi:hypothetical protein [Nocardioides sp.]|uniref:hypothetical protein n=1 Tax=Nocardioides sp. TaxID=35761 RepID=UPI003510DBE3
MKRNILNPADAAWLAGTMARNHARFAGWTMEADPSTSTGPSTEPPGTESSAAATTPPPAAPAAPTTPPSADNPWDDPVAAKAEIERLRRENGAARTNAKNQAAEQARTDLAQTIGKALGLVADDTPVDPAALTEQLTTTQREANQARVELAVYRNAGTAGADPAALLDSASFLAKVANLDPADTAAVQTAIAEAIEANPRLKAAPATRTPAPNPAQGASSATRPRAANLQQAIQERLNAR